MSNFTYNEIDAVLEEFRNLEQPTDWAIAILNERKEQELTLADLKSCQDHWDNVCDRLESDNLA